MLGTKRSRACGSHCQRLRLQGVQMVLLLPSPQAQPAVPELRRAAEEALKFMGLEESARPGARLWKCG